MTDDKKTVVSINREKPEAPAADSNAFFRNPDTLKEHMNVVAALDANRAQQTPDKPATRVASLDSFLIKSNSASFILKRPEIDQSVQEGKVRPFTRAETSKPRKK